MSYADRLTAATARYDALREAARLPAIALVIECALCRGKSAGGWASSGRMQAL